MKIHACTHIHTEVRSGSAVCAWTCWRPLLSLSRTDSLADCWRHVCLCNFLFFYLLSLNTSFRHISVFGIRCASPLQLSSIQQNYMYVSFFFCYERKMSTMRTLLSFNYCCCRLCVLLEVFPIAVCAENNDPHIVGMRVRVCVFVL